MSSLFHSLVVCGAGVTLLNCGGRAQETADPPGAGGTGASAGRVSAGGKGGTLAVGGGMSAGGTLSVGGDVSAGGALSLGGSGFSTGGTLSVGGSGFSTGGTASAVGGSAGNSFAGAGAQGNTNLFQQWDCGADITSGCIGSSPDTSLALTAPCPSNAARPRGPADCPGLVFSCLTGTLNGVSGPINCECLPMSSGVPCLCPKSPDNCASSTPVKCTLTQAQCGCAYTCIVK